jgi:hypothetical protein
MNQGFAARAARRLRLPLPLVVGMALLGGLGVTTRAPSRNLPTLRVGSTYPGVEQKWLIVKRPDLFKNVNHTYKVQWPVISGQ